MVGPLVIAMALATQQGVKLNPAIYHVEQFYGRLYGVDKEGRLIVRQYLPERKTHRIDRFCVVDVSDNVMSAGPIGRIVADCPMDSVVAAAVRIPRGSEGGGGDGGVPIDVKIWAIRKEHAEWLFRR